MACSYAMHFKKRDERTEELTERRTLNMLINIILIDFEEMN